MPVSSNDLSVETRDALGAILQREGASIPDVRDHANRVAATSVSIARFLGMGEAEVASLHLAARLHDVGKMFTPTAILRKPAGFTPEERAIMEKHADSGADLLSQVKGIPAEAVATARYHHERYDGLGYHQLAGESIPFFARIVAVADVHDALVSPRDYKPAMPEEKVLTLMTEDHHGQGLGRRAFDPVLLRAFVGMRLEAVGATFTSSGRANLEAFSVSDPQTDLPPGADVEFDAEGGRSYTRPDGARMVIDRTGHEIAPDVARVLSV